MYHPVISCVCRIGGDIVSVSRSIDCFIQQDYPEKKLIILCSMVTHELIELVSSKKALAKVSLVCTSEDIDWSSKFDFGELVAIWDVNFWYHKSRLSMQQQFLVQQHKSATALLYVLVFDRAGKQSFVSPRALWHETLLFKTSACKDVVKLIVDPADILVDDKIRHALYPANCIYLAIKVIDFSGQDRYSDDAMLQASLKTEEKTSRAIASNIEQDYALLNDKADLSSPDFLADIKYTFVRNSNLI